MRMQVAVSSQAEASAAAAALLKRAINWVDKMFPQQQLLVVYYVSQQYRQRAECEL